MAYEVVMPYHLHMPSYFLETFTEYPYIVMLVRGVYDGNLEEADSSIAIVYMAFNVLCLEFGIQKSKVDKLFKK